jgi:hypothetical protein
MNRKGLKQKKITKFSQYLYKIRPEEKNRFDRNVQNKFTKNRGFLIFAEGVQKIRFFVKQKQLTAEQKQNIEQKRL